MRWSKQTRKRTLVHLKQTSGVKSTSRVNVQVSVQWGKKPGQAFSWKYVWPLDTLNRNVLYFYLELPCSCVNSCQPKLNITQGQYLCSGRTPLCCFVVGFGSSCHTTLGINNWKIVIPDTLKCARCQRLTSHEAEWRATADKKKSFQTSLSFLFFFYQWKEHQRF